MKKLTGGLLLLAFFSCNQPAHKKEAPKQGTIMVKDTVADDLRQLAFAAKKDLVCGMPVSAGVHDTVTYKGKLYGFCAKECKDEFIKDPNQYITAK